MFQPSEGWWVRRFRFVMKTFSRSAWVLLLVLGASTSASGCKERPNKTTPTSASTAQSSEPGSTSGQNVASSGPQKLVQDGIPTSMPKEIAEQLVFRVLVGPQLLIQPDKGIGPIRFGATAETIERLIEAKPTEVVQANGLTVLRYQSHALDFTLQDGALVKIYIHGNEREYVQGKGLTVANSYGIFNGAFANGSKLGMYPNYAKQGEPKRVEKVEPGRFQTVEKHYYDNMVLEYDKLENGNVVLAGVVLTKPGWSEPAGAAPSP